MGRFEIHKFVGAFLVAVFVAVLGTLLSGVIVQPEVLSKNAVEIAAGGSAGGGARKPKGPDPVLALIADADVMAGQKFAKACAACHSFDKGGPNKVGPNLYGVVGRDVASHAGFDYSDAMSGLEGSWDYARLNEFLWKPKKYVPGTKMAYAGLRKPEQRAAVISWLRSLSDTPVDLPTQEQIDAEAAKLAPPAPEVVSDVAPEAEVTGM